MRIRHSSAQEVHLGFHSAEACKARFGLAGKFNAYYALLFLVLLVILAPIWIVKYPGMVDYPNHLVRCYMLAHYHDNPIWQQRFVVVHDPIPNLGIELVVMPLTRLLPLMVCGKVFLSLAAALYVLGCSAVGRYVTGKPNWLALIAAFTFYNQTLFMGFASYVLGIGFFLCAFAFWLRVRDRMTPFHFFLCCLLSIAAFLVHLTSITLLAVACFTVAFLDFLRNRKLPGFIVKVAWLACPLLLMVFFMKSSGRVGHLAWTSPIGKLHGLFQMFSSYRPMLNLIIGVVLLACALVILMRSKIHLTAVAGLVFLLLFFITPMEILTASYVDKRYIVPGFLLLVLSIEPRWGRWQKAAVAVALAVMTIRMGAITADWLTISRRSEQVLAMGQVLPEGSRIYALVPDADDTPKFDRGFIHVIQFWTLSRNADISTLFAMSGQQPLVTRHPPCGGPEWAECFASYDFVWTKVPPPSIREILLGIATPAVTWEKVTLWRVNRSSLSGQRAP
jgi:hypothetical protein